MESEGLGIFCSGEGNQSDDLAHFISEGVGLGCGLQDFWFTSRSQSRWLPKRLFREHHSNPL